MAQNKLDLTQGSWLIKSVRWDKYNYLDNFLLGITKSPDNQHHEKLRSGQHKKYTVFPEGVFLYAQRPSPYPFFGNELKKKKSKRSQHQSASLISPALRSPVFGFDKDRRNKLVGFVFDAKDALINRIFSFDGGTFGRPYESDVYELAQAYYERTVCSQTPKLFNSLEALEKAMADDTVSYNEVTARIRHKTSSKKVEQSGIVVFSDTFEARCIAQYYAKELVKKLKDQFKSKNRAWDSSYEVPIVYYLPQNVKDNMPYTKEEQADDRLVAERLLHDKEALQEKIKAEDYEFLLIIEPNTLMEFLVNNPEVFNVLIKQNHWQMIQAFVDITEMAPQLVELLKQNAQDISLAGLVDSRHKKLTKFIIEHCKPNLDATLDSGETVLFLAAQYGYLDIVEVLLNCVGIDVNSALRVMENLMTPLYIAALLGHHKIVDILLDRGANTNLPLFMAARTGNLHIIKTLLTYEGIDLNKTNDKGNTVLSIAVRHNHFDIVKTLLAYEGINVNQADSDGSTSLSIAVLFGHFDIVKTLLAYKGIDVNQTTDSYGSTSLSIAIQFNRFDMVKTLLAYEGIDVNQADNHGKTPLFWAAHYGHLDVFKLLLNCKGIEIKQSGENFTPLLIAIENNHPEIVRILLTYEGIPINKATREGEPPLLIAAAQGKLDIVEMLLDYDGIDVNRSRSTGATALFVAAKNGHLDIVKILIEKGADINKALINGTTPLVMAKKLNKTDIVNFISAKLQENNLEHSKKLSSKVGNKSQNTSDDPQCSCRIS